MSAPEISIIMPVKNAAKWLDQCLSSVIVQDFESWELLAVDDGSVDDSAENIERFEDADKRIKLLNNEGDGIIDALDTGFRKAKAEYISRMDADDVMPVNKLSTLFTALDRRKNVVVTGKVRYFSDKKVSEGYRRYEQWINRVVEERLFDRELYRECVVASPNWLVHRSCFESDIQINKLSYPEDYDMVFHWLQASYIIEGINVVTHLWREHSERTSRTSEDYQQAAFFTLKTKRFVENFGDQVNGVQLIGKGEKGKLIARQLRAMKIDFQWFDLNPGQDQQSVMGLSPSLSILSNWPLDERIQSDIRKFLRARGLEFGKNVWLF